jgi:integrase
MGVCVVPVQVEPVLSRNPIAARPRRGLRQSSRRPQLAALEAIARRATAVYTAETMPWHRLRRPHVLRIRQLLKDHFQPATANRMLAALRGVLRECWHLGLIPAEDYQAAAAVQAVRGESEPRGRDLSAGELRGFFEACARAPRDASHQQDAGSRRRRDTALLALAYGCGLRRAEVVSLDLCDVDQEAGQLRVRRGKARKPAWRLCPPRPCPRSGLAAGPRIRGGAALLRRAQHLLSVQDGARVRGHRDREACLP